MNKDQLLGLVFLLMSVPLTAQLGKFSASLNYPLTLNDEDLKEVYNGTIGAEVFYQLATAGPIKFDLGVSGTFLDGDPRVPNSITFFSKVRSTLIQPKIQARIDAPGLSKFHPTLALGYTAQFVSYDIQLGREDEGRDLRENFSGFNASLGFQYDFGKLIFFTLQYDYTTLSNIEETGDRSKDIESIGLLKAGLGVRL